jgi:hypothetical protein
VEWKILSGDYSVALPAVYQVIMMSWNFWFILSRIVEPHGLESRGFSSARQQILAAIFNTGGTSARLLGQIDKHWIQINTSELPDRMTNHKQQGKR